MGKPSTLAFRHVRAARLLGVRRLRTASIAVAVLAALLLSGPGAMAAGPSWSVVSSPNPATPAALSGVSCTSSSFCLGVGVYGKAGAERTFGERWNGGSTSLVTAAPAAGYTETELNGISCVSTSFCVAVGRYYKAGADHMILDKWNGTALASMSVPHLFGPGATLDLYSISCKGTTFCMAVGFYTAEPTYPFSMEWNGSAWTEQTVPAPSSTEDMQLSGVSCTSASFCMAVGYTGNNQLIVRWNGSSWSIVDDTTSGISPVAVRCRSTTFCMAVGTSYSGGPNENSLAEEWNGSTWSVLTSPNVSGQSTWLESVSCTGSSFCMASGYSYEESIDIDSTLSERWNGTTWSIVPTVNPTSPYDLLPGVSCAASGSAEFCLAVGQDYNGSVQSTLVEKYS
jgi:hypothetical protein